MKRFLSIFAGLALFAGILQAAVGDAVPLPSWKGRAAANGDVIVKMEAVNSTGTPVPTPSAGGSNVVLNGISGAAATAYYDKLTSSSASIDAGTNYIGAVGVSGGAAASLSTTTAATQSTSGTVANIYGLAVPMYVPVSAPAYAATTSWLAVNVSTLAGASCNDCRLYWQTYNSTGMEWVVNRSHLLTPTARFFTAASATATMDDGFTNGDVFTFRLPTGTSDVYFMAKTRTAR